MNFSKLADDQAEMRERWSSRRRNPVTRKLASADAVEAIEVKQVAEKKDLICHFCKKNPTSAAKRTGEVKPCPSCITKHYYLKRTYGITLRQYHAMLSAQQGKCAVCLEDRGTDLVVDHCHELGHVRGLVCYNCNTLMGLAKESEAVLQNAVKYLKANLLRGGWFARELRVA